MPGKNLDFGKQAETAAAVFLKAQGYKVLKRNYRSKFSEIDIVAEDQGVICFVEVKARHSDNLGGPAEAVSQHKQRQISKAAICYLKENNLLDQAARFDVVTLLYTQASPRIDLIKDAFELSASLNY